MTGEQRRVCTAILAQMRATEVHHGDAIGADAEFHAIARELGLRVIVHPPIDGRDRAFCTGNEILPQNRYKVRNRAIVDAADLVMGTPAGRELESRGSGTWYTLRYAERRGKRVVIVWPNGDAEERGTAPGEVRSASGVTSPPLLGGKTEPGRSPTS